MYQGHFCKRLVMTAIFSPRIYIIEKPYISVHNSVKKICHAAFAKQGVVYESVSNDIFTNLAFEDWVCNRLDLTKSNLLLLWRNKPCVVIGRHQNPWAECQLRQLWGSEVELARRRSGGGSVYHDLGNLNCTFFTDRSEYNRRDNLQLITSAVKSRWSRLDITVSQRDDILLDNFFKISGSSAKLGRQIAYHHCTLLHNVNMQALKTLLHFRKEGLTDRATKSVQSPVRNLSDVNPSISHSGLVESIATEFYSRYPALYEPKVYCIDPASEDDWPGVISCREELKSWEWVYEKTPRFSVKRTDGNVTVWVHVHQACIQGLVLQAPDGWMDIGIIQELNQQLTGQRFWPADLEEVVEDFLSSINVDPVSRKRLQIVCSLLQEAVI